MSEFSAFKEEFLGDLVIPTDPDYETAIHRWASNAIRRAKVVAFATGTADVALALSYAKANKLAIAVRGGGHSPFGASSSEDGLVIDLSRYLNGARVDAEQKLVYVGGGAVWETVDKAAIQHGLATVAGTVNDTGVGGLALGGGYGWLSGSYGLAVDNIVQATVVTANGSVLTASNTENTDLFFGIRGGGVNFGVVTELVLKLHPQRPMVYAGWLTFDPSILEDLLKVVTEWYTTIHDKAGIIVFLSMGAHAQRVLRILVFYDGSEAEGRAHYKAFLDLGPMSDETQEIPYEEMGAIQQFPTFPGQCVSFKGIAQHTSDYKSLSQAWEMIMEVPKIPGFIGGDILLTYAPMSKIISVPLEATAFRRGATAIVLIGLVWKDNTPENEMIARRYARDAADIILHGQSTITTSESLGYANHDPDGSTGDRGAFDKARLVFAENYPRLQKIKMKYDPDVVFNKWLPIVPA